MVLLKRERSFHLRKVCRKQNLNFNPEVHSGYSEFINFLLWQDYHKIKANYIVL